MSKSKPREWGSIRELRPGVFQLRWPSVKPDGLAGPRKSRTVHGTMEDAERALAQERRKFDERASIAAQARIEAVSARYASDETGVSDRLEADPALASALRASSKDGAPKRKRGRPRKKPASIPLGRIWDESYWPHASASGLSPLTLQSYESVWRATVEPALGHMGIEEITHADVQALIDAQTHRVAKSVSSILRILFNHAQYEGIISREANVMADRYKMPPRTKRLHKENDAVYTSGELDEILEACEGEPFEGAAIVSGKGGARLAEACGVRFEEMGFLLDEEGELWCRIDISRNVVRVNGEPCVKDVKTPKSARAIFIREPWARRLQTMHDDAGGEGWLTDDGFGRPMTSQDLSPRWRRWFLGKEFRYVAMLHLRNSYATDLHRQGVDPSRISQILGHSEQSDMLYRFYDRPQPEVIREAIAAPSRASPASGLTAEERALLFKLLSKL